MYECIHVTELLSANLQIINRCNLSYSNIICNKFIFINMIIFYIIYFLININNYINKNK